jgi:hypothetical protein
MISHDYVFVRENAIVVFVTPNDLEAVDADPFAFAGKLRRAATFVKAALVNGKVSQKLNGILLRSTIMIPLIAISAKRT